MTKREEIQKEALTIAISNRRCTAAVSMGVGKTLIGLKYVDHFQKLNKGELKVLVVAPKLSIFDSWKNDSVTFNIDISNIEFCTYIGLKKKQPEDYHIVILDECHSLLYSHKPFLAMFSGKIL